MNLGLGALLNFVLIWFELDWTWDWFDWIWFDIDWIWFDWIRVGLDLIKTLWGGKQVNVGFEWKSNGDNAPMSKVEDWWKIELEEDVNGMRKIDDGWRCKWIELGID